MNSQSQCTSRKANNNPLQINEMQKIHNEILFRSIIVETNQQNGNTHNQYHIELKLLIENQEQTIRWLKDGPKYTNYIQNILYFFSLSNNVSRLILSQRWNPIIPQESDSTLEETIINTNFPLRAQLIEQYLYDLAMHFNNSQDNYEKQLNKISQYQEQIIQNKEKFDQLTKQENQLLTMQDQLREDYIFIELNYHKYLQNIKKDNILKDNSKVLKGMSEYILKLLDDMYQIKEQHSKLSEQIFLQQQLIDNGTKQIQELENQKLIFQGQLSQSINQQEQQSENKEQENENNQLQNQTQMQEQKQPQQHQQQQQQQQIKQPFLSFTLQIKSIKFSYKKPNSKKYNDFVYDIQKNYFSKPKQTLENESNSSKINKHILTQSFKFQQTPQDTAVNKKLLKDFLSDLAKHLNELLEINRKQGRKISDLKQQFKKDQQIIQHQKNQIKNRNSEYNKLKEKRRLIESIYSKLLEITETNQFIKEDSDLIKQMNIFMYNILQDKSNMVVQNSKLSKLWSQQVQSFELQNQQILNISSENLTLEVKVNQQQQQQQQQQYKSQIKIKIPNVQQSQRLSNTIDSNITINSNDIDINKLNEIQQAQFEHRQLQKKSLNCYYCYQSFSDSQYIKLQCLHSYHKDCLEKIGSQALTNELGVVTCFCNKKISTKLFSKWTCRQILKNQAAQIFTKYEQSHELLKCSDCQFFYKKNDKEQSNCIICNNSQG